MTIVELGADQDIDLTLIILSFNTRELTTACVAAVLRDARDIAQAVEVVVVDNASADGTPSALRAAFGPVNVIVNPANFGWAGGNNVGLAATRGRYRLLLNSDAEVQLGSLAALIEFMDAHPEAGACGPMLLNLDGSLQPSGRDLPSVWSVFADMTRLYRLWQRDRYAQRGRDYGQIAQVEEISGAALLVRASVYEQVGGLDPNLFAFYEDVDWCQRIGAAGYGVFYVPAARVVHQWHATSSGVSALAYRAAQDSLRYYFAKHHGSAAQGAIQALLAGRELALLAVAALRRDGAGWRFHGEMLRRVLAPVASTADKDEAHARQHV